MVFNASDEFYNYPHSLDSPGLGLIALPMSGYDKSLDGMINFSNAGISFPHSNAFGPYGNAYLMPQMYDEYAVTGPYQEGEPECTPDSDFGCSIDYDAEPSLPLIVSNQVNSAPHVADSVPQIASRKRKASLSLEREQPRPRKKAAVTHRNGRDSDADLYEWDEPPAPPSPYGTVPASYTANSSPRPSHHYSTSNASRVSMAAPSPFTPFTPGFSPSYTTVKTEQSPRAPMTPIPRAASASTPYRTSMPMLVRTSTISQMPSMAGHAHTHPFNPYALPLRKPAIIRLKGDLDSVAQTWSEEELGAGRKLVVFTPRLTGHVVDAEFKVIPQDEWNKESITVNCIWWKEREGAYVTSVDTISLLEGLVNVYFTVEEKNRIRRNLEGFRPSTVSKGKTATENFFKVIMGFPMPKPRHIEKDIKVFPWETLARGLNKIISKYSASPASTKSVMKTPAASKYAGTEHSTEYQLAPSRNHEASSQNMAPGLVPVMGYEQHMLSNGTATPVGSSVPELSLQAPDVPQPFDTMHAHDYNTASMGAFASPAPQPCMSAPAQYPVTGWSYQNFIPTEGPMPMQAVSTPVSAYSQTYNETADFIIPVGYQHAYYN